MPADPNKIDVRFAVKSATHKMLLHKLQNGGEIYAIASRVTQAEANKLMKRWLKRNRPHLERMIREHVAKHAEQMMKRAEATWKRDIDRRTKYYMRDALDR